MWSGLLYAQRETWMLVVASEDYRKVVGRQVDPQLEHALRENSLFTEVPI
jgi:hypothetical protein